MFEPAVGGWPRPSWATTLAYRDGRRETITADGTTNTSWLSPDPRHGMLAPFTSRTQVTRPAV